MRIKEVKGWVLSAMFLALGLLFPSIFHLFGAGAGQVFLPMHIPVLICGLFCGPIFGGIVGILTPFLSSIFSGMPVLFPTGIAMMFELATYGLVGGSLLKKHSIYPSLLGAMLCGRFVNGIITAVLLGAAHHPYSIMTFINTAFIISIPGICIQLIVVPISVTILKKLHLSITSK